MDYLIEYDYNADEVDELTIRKGDIVNKVKHYEDGWLFGVLRGKEGVFPSNFGKPVKDEKKKISDEEVSEVTEDSKNVSVDEDDNSDQVRPAKKVTGVGYGNIFMGGKIQLKQTNNNRDVISKEKRNAVTDENKQETVIENKAINKSKPVEMARVVHSYKAENFDELTLEEGELITIIDKENEDDGWWKGKLSNGQIGVFPDNFVELVKTPLDEKPPSRPQLTKGPPPVTAAKPKPPRPPVLQSSSVSVSETKTTSSKAPPRTANQEKEDGISFDTVQSHKLLVGPNADRVKHRGKKPPSSVNVVLSEANTEDKPVAADDERKPVTSSSHAPKAVSKESAPPHPEKLPELTAPKSKHWSGPNVNIDPVPDSTTKPKMNRDSGSASVTATSTTPVVDRSPDIFGTKLRPTRDASYEKPALDTTTPSEVKTGGSNSRFSGPPKKLEIADSSSKDELVNGLQKKVSILQEENGDLRRELSDLRKSTGDQIAWLKTKLNKLIDEFDDEKVKRAANEVNFNRLKTSVEDLEATMLSRAHE